MLGIIIAAGKQTRFERDIPKCMMPYKQSNVLVINILTMMNACDKVVVVTSKNDALPIQETLDKYFSLNPRVEMLIIESGKGCGHAVFNALLRIFPEDGGAVIKWGDAIHDDNKYYDFVKSVDCKSDIYIPCEYVEDPYTLAEYHFDDKRRIIDRFLFADEIESPCIGWHDLSIFYFPRIRTFLNQIYVQYFNYENKFLKSIFEMGQTIEMVTSVLKSKSYNTVEEFDAL